MSKYFTPDEVKCKCCGKLPPNGMSQDLMRLLDDMREQLGAPMELTCAYRCPAHNAEVGGVPNSQHVTGCAADIDASVHGVDKLAKLARNLKADGIGKYYGDCFVHVDTRDGRTDAGYAWVG